MPFSILPFLILLEVQVYKNTKSVLIPVQVKKKKKRSYLKFVFLQSLRLFCHFSLDVWRHFMESLQLPSAWEITED